jgi:hypothetical protein
MTAAALAPVPAAKASLETLQVGMGWFGEQPGGLNRVYANLVDQLVRSGVDLQGLVVGTPEVARHSRGMVLGVARPSAPLLYRMHALRRAASEWLRTRPDAIVVSHFAQNGFPLLDSLG